jgi:DNA-binding NtrC family response regulator
MRSLPDLAREETVPTRRSHSTVDGGEPPYRGAVLIVDDEPSISRVVACFLGRLGYRVATAGCAGSALDLLAGEAFDLMITDLYMPGQNGIDLGAEALRLHPEMKLLLCTGLIDPATWSRAAAVGFAGLVRKPFGREELDDAVRGVLAPDGIAA